MLVRLSLANFSYFNDTKPDGSDFRLVGGDDKTPLKYHFEKYDPQDQMALLWVRVPQLTGGAKSDKIYAYYGNRRCAGRRATCPAPTMPRRRWCCPSPTPPGLPPKDSTAYKNNPSRLDRRCCRRPSLIGGGAKFSGKESITRAGERLAASAAEPGLHRLGVAARRAGAASGDARAERSGQIARARRSTARKLAARATFGGAPVTATQGADSELEPVASRRADRRRRQAHAVRRRCCRSAARRSRRSRSAATFTIGAADGGRIPHRRDRRGRGRPRWRGRADWIKASRAQPGHGRAIWSCTAPTASARAAARAPISSPSPRT